MRKLFALLIVATSIYARVLSPSEIAAIHAEIDVHAAGAQYFLDNAESEESAALWQGVVNGLNDSHAYVDYSQESEEIISLLDFEASFGFYLESVTTGTESIFWHGWACGLAVVSGVVGGI